MIHTVGTTLTAIAKALRLYNDVTNSYQTKSLADVGKLTRVQPLTILSRDTINLPYIQDINNTLLSLFSAYYLQAVNAITSVKSVEVIRILDRLNPDRDGTGLMLQNPYLNQTQSLESYKYKLPTTANSVSFESDKKDKGFTSLDEASNLAVGKLMNVCISVPEGPNGEFKSANVPMSIRLDVQITTNDNVVKMLSPHREDISFTERYHQWQAGQISFFSDLVFCQDLIDEQKRVLAQDKTGVSAEVLRRATNAKKFGILTSNPSLASASNLYVITEEQARQVEERLGGKLTNFKTREKLFAPNYAFIIAVVDREYERVNFYIRGLHSYSDLSIKEVKGIAKDKGPDITDIFRSMQMGASPF